LHISHVPECIEKTKRQLLPCETEYMKIASYKWKEMHHRRAFWSLKGNVKRKSTYRKDTKKTLPPLLSASHSAIPKNMYVQVYLF
jgi:hypothetical protein